MEISHVLEVLRSKFGGFGLRGNHWGCVGVGRDVGDDPCCVKRGQPHNFTIRHYFYTAEEDYIPV